MSKEKVVKGTLWLIALTIPIRYLPLVFILAVIVTLLANRGRYLKAVKPDINPTVWVNGFEIYCSNEMLRYITKNYIEKDISNVVVAMSPFGASIFAPDNFMSWPEHIRKAVIAHEIGHVMNKDWMKKDLQGSYLIASLKRFWKGAICGKPCQIELAADEVAMQFIGSDNFAKAMEDFIKIIGKNRELKIRIKIAKEKAICKNPEMDIVFSAINPVEKAIDTMLNDL